MQNLLEIHYDERNKRFVIKAPFYLADVCRAFPSRRFDPKTKTWRAPLVHANLRHIKQLPSHIYQLSPVAQIAIKNAEALMSGPTYQPFPRHVYSFGNKTPFKHQEEMLDKGWGLSAYAVFAAMGTGKTFTTIHMACARFKAGLIDRLVIVCPATLRRTWMKEFEKYATVPYNFIFHESKIRCHRPESGVLDVVAISVEGLGISERLFDTACSWFIEANCMCVVDESSKIKSPERKRTERAITLGANAKYRMILNGTPIAKGIQDLWSQFEFLDPNIIGTGDYWAFKTRYIATGGFDNKQIIGYQNVEELMELVRPYSIEVSKSLLDLPPKIPKTRYCEATSEQKILFKQILSGVKQEGQKDIAVQNVLERMLRLQQVIGGFRPETNLETGETITHKLKDNPKLDALLEIIDDNPEAKFIIWARYVPEIELLVKTLRDKYPDSRVLEYYGATDQNERSRAEDAYCNDPQARFFVGNPAAAGLGLTLISGLDDIMVYYSGTFAYIDRAQSEDRAHRIGQKRSVSVIDIIMEKTLDETIMAAISEKKSMDTYVKDQIAAGKSVQSILAGDV